jgi:rubrerythrin
MPQIKIHKTVEQIAKKHRLDVSFIQKQLEMGEPIEHEHTQDHDLARDIALQHLDEIPDYYTRLKKMEASAKKEYKKSKDVSEEGLRDWFGKSKSKDGKSGWVNVVTGGTCASDEPGEGVPKCVSSSKRASMTPAERLSAARRKKLVDSGQQQKTGGAKPTYVPTDKPKKKMNEEADKKGKGSGKKDACYNKVKSRYDVWPSAYASGALVKCRKVGAANWGTKSEATEEQRYCPLCDKRETRSECSYGGKAWDKVSIKDHEYSMARSELKTIADAVKRLQAKVGRGEGDLEAWVQSKITKAADYIDTAADYVGSGEMDEACWSGYKQVGMKKKGKKMVPNCVPEQTIEDVNGNTFAEVVDIIKPELIRGFKSQIKESIRLQAQTGNIVAVTLSWRGKYYAIRMFFPQTKLPSRQEVTDEIQKVYPGGRVVYHSISEFTPGQPLIQAGFQGGVAGKIGPSKKYVQPYSEQVEIGEDWQKINRQDKTDGLSTSAVKAYRRENPGSKLQTAVTEKKPTGKRAKRRSSFCSRMKGMKSKLTSAETARDPDSRINRALRRWNCN